MNATHCMGNPARNPLAAFLPHFPLPKAGKRKPSPECLYLKASATGLIVYRDDTPLAWIYAGYHNGTIDGKPATCRFVDVAYHRQTEHGVNLETADFDTLEQAIDFLQAEFSPNPMKVFYGDWLTFAEIAELAAIVLKRQSAGGFATSVGYPANGGAA